MTHLWDGMGGGSGIILTARFTVVLFLKVVDGVESLCRF